MRISDWSSDVCSSDLGGRVPDAKDEPAEVVVVVKGPTQSILLREKQKIAGIWINAASMRFRSAPSFYAIASPEPIGKLVDARTRAIYELGHDSLQLPPASTEPLAQQTRFPEGLVDVRPRAGPTVAEPAGVENPPRLPILPRTPPTTPH